MHALSLNGKKFGMQCAVCGDAEFYTYFMPLLLEMELSWKQGQVGGHHLMIGAIFRCGWDWESDGKDLAGSWSC